MACVRATSFARVREHVFSDFLAIRLSILVDGHAIVVLDVDLKLEAPRRRTRVKCVSQVDVGWQKANTLHLEYDCLTLDIHNSVVA